jgi:kumamolisin
VPTKALANAKGLGELASDTQISMAFVLPLRNQGELPELLRRIYDPTDPLYGHYLTHQEFTDRFGPTQADYDAVTAYARSLGFTVSGTHPGRTLLDVTGPSGIVESAFNLHLKQYQAPTGRKFYAPDNDPEVTDTIASKIVGVVGLDNSAVWRAHNHVVPASVIAQAGPLQIGSGPNGGLSPKDILTAYNLNGVTANGSGQTLGLFELDGYKSSDVASYVSNFGLPSIPLTNVLIDGSSGSAGSGADEVTLDIELQIALAPGASKIIVYEGPNSFTGLVDTYDRIATDNLAKQISTSWGLSEGEINSTFRNYENAAFVNMAAQGQSIYAASGDSGAYENGSTLSVGDPASQPYMVGVGGSQLYVNSGETYNYETTWNVNNTISGGAGGGGVSSVWGIPTWQKGIATAASTTMRNVPDVSLNADQYTGYSIYYNGGWTIYGGTSCAAPLWAAFTARVNQQRTANGLQPLGFANPVIYQIAAGQNYGSDFHDITQGTNLYYSAGVGYDNATGWGSFNGANLLTDLAPTSVPTSPSGLTATAGNGQATVSFTAPTSNGGGVILNYSVTSNPGNITATGSASPVTITGLTNGTAYTFTATATNAAGTGPASAPSNSITPATSPGAPTGVTAVAGNGQATVSFTPPASNGGSTILYYTVTSSPGNITATGSASPITITGLTNGTAYTFTVTATNDASTGPASAPSNSITPASPPGAPTGVTAVAGNGQATVSFTAPVSNGGSAILYYTVTSSPGNITTTGSASPITITGLTDGTAYTFTVTATNSAGTGPASAPSAAVTPATAAAVPALRPHALFGVALILGGILWRRREM